MLGRDYAALRTVLVFSGIDRQEGDMADDATTLGNAAIDAGSVKAVTGTNYPEPMRKYVAGRAKRKLGDAFGLKNFGINLTTLAPGAMSALRHWHTRQDEFIYMLEGEAILVTDAGEQMIRPGMIAGFPAGKKDGHHLINRSDRDVVYLEIGDRLPGDEADYPDLDMVTRQQPDGRWVYFHRNGEPY
jgi:uncharacterized cupin superfamily protein